MAENFNDEITCRTDEGCVIIGAHYESHKGELYTVVEVGMHTETKEALVIYRAKKDDKIHCRPLRTESKAGWFDYVKWEDGRMRHRFEKTTWFHFTHGHKRARKGKK